MIGTGRVTADKFGTLPTVAVTQGVSQEGDGQALNFGLELFDVSEMHAAGGDNTRLVAPIDGIYQVTARVSWLPDGGGIRTIVIRKNGVTVVAEDIEVPSPGAIQTDNAASVPVKLAANDYLQVFANETSAVDVDVFSCTPSDYCPHFSMYWVAPR